MNFTLSIESQLRMAANAWKPGTKMQAIIDDGWSRGFRPEQTLRECSAAGYSFCIAEPAINARWSSLDISIKEHMERENTRAEAIGRYLAYWDRNLYRNHHLIDCPNPCCDERLKIARPPKGSGDMWDSLATCPYCTGTFFYESRPLRIDVSFKGFI